MKRLWLNVKRPHLSEKAKDVWQAVAIVFLGALVIVCLAATLITVSGHNSDLKKIAQQNEKILGLERQVIVLHRQGVEATDRLNTETKVVDGYAKALEIEIADNHDAGTANLQAICSAIPGCVLPSP